MGKYKLRKAKNITIQNRSEHEEMASGEGDVEVDTVEANERVDMNTLQASIKATHADIKAGHADLKRELNGFRETIKRDMKEELGNFKEEVNQKLSEIGVELNNAQVRLDEVETRVAEVEEWDANAKSVLLETLQQQEHILSKLVDLEARSRRNNLRIFGIPEGEEPTIPVRS